MINTLLLVVYLAIASLGMVFLKKGGDSLSLKVSGDKIIRFNIGIITALGFLFNLCSFVIYQILLGKFDISWLVPMVIGINQIIVLFLGVLLFKEKINKINILGFIILILGIVLIGF